MTTPRPKPAPRWTWTDHLDNNQRIQRAADQKLWNALGRLIGLRRGELAALLGRFLDDRIAAALRAQPTILIDQLTAPDQADALRNALGDLMCDDIASMVQILTSAGSTNDTRNKAETPGNGEADAADHERDLHDDEAQEEDEAGDARE